MLDLAVRNLKFRMLRTILTVLGVAASVMVVVILSYIFDFMLDDMTEELSRYAGQVQVRTTIPGKTGRSVASPVLDLGEAKATQVLAAASGYDPARTSPVLYVEVEPARYPNGPADLALVGLRLGSEAAVVGGVKMKAGTATLDQPGDAIVGPGLAERKGVSVGESMEIGGKMFLVRGILGSQAGILKGLLLTSITDAQAFTGREGSISAVWIGYRDISRAAAVKAELKAAFPDLDVVTQDDLLASTQEVLRDQASFFNIMNYNVAGTAIVIIALVMYTAVMERTREIGTLRALGVPRGQVVAGLMQEATLLGAIGGLLGGVTGPLMLKLMMGHDNALADIYVGALPNLGLAILMAMVIALAACAYPAWRAAKVDPIEALRYE